MNNFLITGKLPCHTENLHITPKQEKLILWPEDDYVLTLPTLKWKLHFFLEKKRNKQTGKKHNRAMTTTTETSKHTSTKKQNKRKQTNKQTKEK